MAIPKYDEMYPFVMKILSDGKERSVKEIREELIKSLNLKEEDLQEMLPSKKMSTFANRSGWTIQYLFQAELLDRPHKARYVLSQRGREHIAKYGFDVSTSDLKKSTKFLRFQTVSTDTKPIDDGQNGTENIEPSDETPEDRMEEAFQIIRRQLKEELMYEVMAMSPAFFEGLVLDLLVKMGYGGKNKLNIIRTPISNDGGIDGLIKEDALGLDYIYIQAKRWKEDSIVSRPEIQSFLGALNGQGAKKGVFITTSKYSSGALEFANKLLSTKVVLIDGDDLMDLMLTYGVGVSVSQVYEIKKIDRDYFIEEE